MTHHRKKDKWKYLRTRRINQIKESYQQMSQQQQESCACSSHCDDTIVKLIGLNSERSSVQVGSFVGHHGWMSVVFLDELYLRVEVAEADCWLHASSLGPSVDRQLLHVLMLTFVVPYHSGEVLVVSCTEEELPYVGEWWQERAFG